VEQAHPEDFQIGVALLAVAPGATRREIVFAVSATGSARDDVIQGHLIKQGNE
jgi:hypothetical protein